MFLLSSMVFWTSFAGSLFLILGFILYRRDIASARGLDKLIVLGPIFVAAPLATFGAEHLRAGRFMASMVPRWIPWHVFWIYFVGLCLIAAALSFTFRKCLFWSASLLAILFLIFISTMDLPGTIAQPNRIDWVLLFRETSFGLGGLTLAVIVQQSKGAFTIHPEFTGFPRIVIAIIRIAFGLILVFYGIQHFLHSECVSGVPLEKVTPAWFPLRFFITDLAGAIELVAGIALVINRRPRFAAALVGLLNTALVLFFYVPILATDRGTEQLVEGINYVFDTLLFAGTALLIAAAMPRKNDREPSAAKPA